jgi:hypothetical protein
MISPTGRFTVAVFGVLVTTFLAGCGATSESPSASQPPRSSVSENAQDAVLAMVLNDGDIAGFRMQSDGGERLQDQLPVMGTPHYAAMKRLVTANWLASGHSWLVRTANNGAGLYSDANLFTSTDAAAQIWRLEQSPPPGIRVRRLRPPAGSPTGAAYNYENTGKVAGFQLGWRRGPVIAYVLLEAHPNETFTTAGLRRIAAFLAEAARAQDHRIANVQASVSAS